jgi:hypothetical protein
MHRSQPARGEHEGGDKVTGGEVKKVKKVIEMMRPPGFQSYRGPLTGLLSEQWGGAHPTVR